MNLTFDSLCTALSEVLNAPERPPVLFPLARIKYPLRELQPVQIAPHVVCCRLSFYGWEYKHRGPRPKQMPVVDCAELERALNTALNPKGFKILSLEVNEKFLKLEVRIC